MTRHTKTEISESVMKQIKHGSVTMKPRVFFSLLTALAIVAVVSAAIATAYAANIVFFWWRVQASDTMAWGARANLSAAIDSFPWWALLLAGVMLGVAVWLIKRWGGLYRYKTRTIVTVIVLASLFVGFAVSTFMPLSIRDAMPESGDFRHDRRRSNF